MSRSLSRAERLAEANRHGVDRLLAVARDSHFTIMHGELATQEEFLLLAWQNSADTRVLVPAGQPRTVESAATVLLKRFGDFETLLNSPDVSEREKIWFRRCVELEDKPFAVERMLAPWIVPVDGDETRMSPRTILYIWEGNHTCLVLAKQLLQGWLKWEPTPAIWVLPRPP